MSVYAIVSVIFGRVIEICPPRLGFLCICERSREEHTPKCNSSPRGRQGVVQQCNYCGNDTFSLGFTGLFIAARGSHQTR
jgi:hypothetical protein